MMNKQSAEKMIRQMAEELPRVLPSQIGYRINIMSGLCDQYGLYLHRFIDVDDYREILIAEGRMDEND
jgi:hypothetical protein